MENIYAKMCNYIKRHKVLIYASIIVFLLPIVIIHVIFKIKALNTWFVPNWTAGELLNYCGSVIGAIATILAIIFTILFTQQNQRDERRLSIKPHLNTKWIDVVDINGEVTYLEYTYREESTNEVVFTHIKFDPVYAKPKFYKHCYILSNIGAGNAVNINLTINNLVTYNPFSLAVNTNKAFVIYIDPILVKTQERPVTFEFIYSDVASISKYKQSETFTFSPCEPGFLSIKQYGHDMVTPPEEVYN